PRPRPAAIRTRREPRATSPCPGSASADRDAGGRPGRRPTDGRGISAAVSSPPSAVDGWGPPRGGSRRAYPSVAEASPSPPRNRQPRTAPWRQQAGTPERRGGIAIAARGGPGYRTGGRVLPSSAASPPPPTPDSRGRPGGVRSAVRRPRDKGTVARGAADGRTG